MRYGSEEVTTYVEWYEAQARPNPPQQVHDYWWATWWKIALGMRMGQDLRADIAVLQEAVLTPPKNVAGSALSDEETIERPPKKGDEGKGKGNDRKGRWKKRQYKDTQDQWWKKSQWQTPSPDAQEAHWVRHHRARPVRWDWGGTLPDQTGVRHAPHQGRRPDHRPDGPEADPDRGRAMTANAAPLPLHGQAHAGGAEHTNATPLWIPVRERHHGHKPRQGQLRCPARPAGLSDFGWVNRPRLWWTSIDWKLNTTTPRNDEATSTSTRASTYTRVSPPADWLRRRLQRQRRMIMAARRPRPPGPDPHARWLTDKSATFLATSYGMTVWFHLAMCFGATASVWNFSRVTDAPHS